MKSKEDNTQKKSKKLSSKGLSWVLYDVGNSAYTLLACALIPIWYKSLAVGDGAGQISSDVYKRQGHVWISRCNKRELVYLTINRF